MLDINLIWNKNYKKILLLIKYKSMTLHSNVLQTSNILPSHLYLSNL